MLTHCMAKSRMSAPTSVEPVTLKLPMRKAGIAFVVLSARSPDLQLDIRTIRKEMNDRFVLSMPHECALHVTFERY